MTQDQLATLSLGQPWQISRGAISAIERGRNLPSVPALVAFRRILYIDPQAVLERTEGAVRPALEIASENHECLSALAARLSQTGDFRGAITLYDAIIERLAREADPRPPAREEVLAGIELSRAHAFLCCGALHAGRSPAERVITLAHEDASSRVQAYALLSELQLRLRSLPLAVDAAVRALELSEGCDARVQMLAFAAEAHCRLEERRYADAISSFSKTREKAQEAREDSQVTRATGSMGICCARLGQRRQARRWLEEAVGLARRNAQPACEGEWLVELGQLALEENRPDEADRLALAAVAVGKPREHWVTVLRAEWLRHLVFRARNPGQQDRHRLGCLRRLLSRIDCGESDPMLQEVRRAILV